MFWVGASQRSIPKFGITRVLGRWGQPKVHSKIWNHSCFGSLGPAKDPFQNLKSLVFWVGASQRSIPKFGNTLVLGRGQPKIHSQICNHSCFGSVGPAKDPFQNLESLVFWVVGATPTWKLPGGMSNLELIKQRVFGVPLLVG